MHRTVVSNKNDYRILVFFSESLSNIPFEKCKDFFDYLFMYTYMFFESSK